MKLEVVVMVSIKRDLMAVLMVEVAAVEVEVAVAAVDVMVDVAAVEVVVEVAAVNVMVELKIAAVEVVVEVAAVMVEVSAVDAMAAGREMAVVLKVDLSVMDTVSVQMQVMVVLVAVEEELVPAEVVHKCATMVALRMLAAVGSHPLCVFGIQCKSREKTFILQGSRFNAFVASSSCKCTRQEAASHTNTLTH